MQFIAVNWGRKGKFASKFEDSAGKKGYEPTAAALQRSELVEDELWTTPRLACHRAHAAVPIHRRSGASSTSTTAAVETADVRRRRR